MKISVNLLARHSINVPKSFFVASSSSFTNHLYSVRRKSICELNEAWSFWEFNAICVFIFFWVEWIVWLQQIPYTTESLLWFGCFLFAHTHAHTTSLIEFLWKISMAFLVWKFEAFCFWLSLTQICYLKKKNNRFILNGFNLAFMRIYRANPSGIKHCHALLCRCNGTVYRM